MNSEKQNSYQSPRGTYDILPDEVGEWRMVESTFRELCARYNYHEIRTPLFEHSEVFSRAVGEASDVVVTKQMYQFTAADEQSYTLRAEGTAPVVRAYVQHHLSARGPVSKLFYICPVFRYERVQAGRTRQHHQCGIEMLGAQSPQADAEVLSLANDFLKSLGIESTLLLNSLGTRESRAGYIQQLKGFLEPHRAELSEESQKRLDLNPLRVFDSKDGRDIKVLFGAPHILDFLKENDIDSAEHFQQVLSILDSLKIEYEVDHQLVRGFDYYSHTAFEFVSDALGAQSTVLGGGRYDGLVEELGGDPTPGIGFGCGIERLLLARGESDKSTLGPTAFVVTLGDRAKAAAPGIVKQMRDANISCDCDFVGRSMKAQMREANRQGANYVLILGDDELDNNSVSLKNMSDSSQESLSLGEALERMGERVNG